MEDKTVLYERHISRLEAAYWEVWTNEKLAMDQRWAIVADACDYSANDYGWGNILEEGLDCVFGTDAFTQNGPQIQGEPICSELAARAYRSIGVRLGPTDARSIAPSRKPPFIGIAEYVTANRPERVCMGVKDTGAQAGT